MSEGYQQAQELQRQLEQQRREQAAQQSQQAQSIIEQQQREQRQQQTAQSTPSGDSIMAREPSKQRSLQIDQALLNVAKGNLSNAQTQYTQAIATQKTILESAAKAIHYNDDGTIASAELRQGYDVQSFAKAQDNYNRLIRDKGKLDSASKQYVVYQAKLNLAKSRLSDGAAVESVKYPSGGFEVTVDGKKYTFRSYDEAFRFSVDNQKYPVTYTDSKGQKQIRLFNSPDQAIHFINQLEDGSVQAAEFKNPTKGYQPDLTVTWSPHLSSGRSVTSFSIPKAVEYLGNLLDTEAANEKLYGSSALAGVLYSSGRAFKLGTGMVLGGAYLPNTVYTAATDPDEIVESLKGDPIVTLSNLAVLGGGVYQGIKSYQASKIAAGNTAVLRNLSKFEEFTLPNPYEEVAMTYPEGSPEYTSAMLTRGSPIAYAMVDLDQINQLPNLRNTGIVRPSYVSLNAPVYYYRSTGVPASSSGLLAEALGAAGLSSLISKVKLSQPEMTVVNAGQALAYKVNLDTPVISDAEVIQSLRIEPISVMRVDALSEAVQVSDVAQAQEQISIQEPIAVQETVSVEEPAPELETPSTVSPELPQFEPPEVTSPTVLKLDKDEQLRQAGGVVKRGVAPLFRVVLDGRVSTVEASTFTEALQRVSGGRGSRATVTRLS